jgi:hypothetical protein
MTDAIAQFDRPPLTRVETILANLGLSQPGVRFIAVAVGATTLLFAVRPECIFMEDGRLNPNAPFPWWLPGVTLGMIAALFV